MNSPSNINELRELVSQSCCQHDEQATRTIDSYGTDLGPAVHQMLADDLDRSAETRGEFAVWLVAELTLFDLMRHPDELLLVNWITIPHYPTCSEEGPEQGWYIESQSLSEALSLEQACDLFSVALQSSHEKLRRRAQRAWQAIEGISGSSHNPRGTTLRRRYEEYRDQMLELLTLAAAAEDVESRDAAEWALAVCREGQEN